MTRFQILNIVNDYRVVIDKEEVINTLVSDYGYSESDFEGLSIVEIIDILTSEEFVDLLAYTKVKV